MDHCAIIKNNHTLSEEGSMNEKEQKKAAKESTARWQGKGYEKEQSQQFWIDLLVTV